MSRKKVPQNKLRDFPAKEPGNYFLPSSLRTSLRSLWISLLSFCTFFSSFTASLGWPFFSARFLLATSAAFLSSSLRTSFLSCFTSCACARTGAKATAIKIAPVAITFVSFMTVRVLLLFDGTNLQPENEEIMKAYYLLLDDQ